MLITTFTGLTGEQDRGKKSGPMATGASKKGERHGHLKKWYNKILTVRSMSGQLIMNAVFSRKIRQFSRQGQELKQETGGHSLGEHLDRKVEDPQEGPASRDSFR